MLRYSLRRAFADNSGMSADELAMIERLALRDGIVDDREREILSRVFARLDEQNVPKEVWEEIGRFKAQHGIA
jgi:hypothetical protein